MFGNATGQLEIGVEPWKAQCDVIKRGGAGVKGYVYAFDLSNADGDVTNNVPGDRASGFANVRAPVSADLSYGQFCVLEDDCADNARVKATYRGAVNAFVIKGSGNIAKGDPLTVSTGGVFNATLAAGNKIVARALEDVTAPGATPTACKVAFEGIHAIGVQTS